MRTLVISEIFPPKVGGSGRWFWEIYTRMERDRYMFAAGADPLAAGFDQTHSFTCLRWPLSFPGSWGVTSLPSLRKYVRLLQLLRSVVTTYGITSIHCGRGLPEGLLAYCVWKLFKVPYLCYVHGEEIPAYAASREYSFLARLVYQNARRVIVNSENTHRSFSAFTGIENSVRVMQPGYDAGFFSPCAINSQFREKHGWTGRKVVLTVGRLQRRKGHDHVIMALQRIREQVPDVLYVIVGDGEEREFLENLVAEFQLRSYVQFMGKVDDATMLSCYQQSDLFVLANRDVDGDFEGFGMVLVEAQACGKPVIAGLSGGTAETLQPGETGILVDAAYPELIAGAVVTLLQDDPLRNAMGVHAAEWVSSHFEWGNLVVQAKGIFMELGSCRARF